MNMWYSMYLFKEFATLHHALTKDQAIPPATLTFQPSPVSSIFLEATARRIAKHKDAQSAKRFPGRKQSDKKNMSVGHQDAIGWSTCKAEEANFTLPHTLLKTNILYSPFKGTFWRWFSQLPQVGDMFVPCGKTAKGLSGKLRVCSAGTISIAASNRAHIIWRPGWGKITNLGGLA